MLAMSPGILMLRARYYDDFNHVTGYSRAEEDAVFEMMNFDVEHCDIYKFMYMLILSPYHWAPNFVAALKPQDKLDIIIEALGLPLPSHYALAEAIQWAALALQTVYPLFMFAALLRNGDSFIFRRVRDELSGLLGALMHYYVFWFIFPTWFYSLLTALEVVLIMINLTIAQPIWFFFVTLNGWNPVYTKLDGRGRLRRLSSDDVVLGLLRDYS